MLASHNLACTRGDRHLFGQLSFTLSSGEALRVAGPNGQGKTSLLRILCGLSAPEQGEVRWNGADIRQLREDFRASLVYIGHLPGVKDDLLAWENLSCSQAMCGAPVTEDAARAALDTLGIGMAADLPARALSLGQRKRVALARLQLAQTARLWVLDEPFTALDHTAVGQLCATLDGHLARGGILVYTTHQDLGPTQARQLDLAECAPC